MNVRLKLDRQTVLRLLMGFPVQVPTPLGLLEFECEQNRWQPVKRIAMSRTVQEAHRRIDMDPKDMEVWSNDIYEVFVKPMTPDGKGGPCHMSVKRYDRTPVHNWRHLQQMKNEIFGEYREAVELYPSEARIADNANQTHLWVMEEGNVLPIGFPAGFTLTEAETERMNANGNKARQEPQQPGLTTGDPIRKARAEGAVPPEQEEAFQRIIDGEHPAQQPRRPR